MSKFIVIDRDTAYLLPPSLQDWLSEDHLARFVVEVIDPLDLSGMVAQYAGRGSRLESASLGHTRGALGLRLRHRRLLEPKD